MTRFPAICTPSTTIQAAARLMVSADCGAIPVTGELDEFPLGIITDRDIAVRGTANGRGPETLVSECMTMPVFTVTEDTDLADCIELLEERQVRRAIVVDTTGRCVGIISQADIASHASKRTAGELLQYVSRTAHHVRVQPSERS